MRLSMTKLMRSRGLSLSLFRAHSGSSGSSRSSLPEAPSSALDRVVFPVVFPFKVIALNSPAIAEEILTLAQHLLHHRRPPSDCGPSAAETHSEARIEAGAEAGAGAGGVPHTITVKGKYMSLTLLPVLHHSSQVADVYSMLQQVKDSDPLQHIKLVL